MLVGYYIFVAEKIAWAEVVKEVEVVCKLRDLVGDYGLKCDGSRDELNVLLLQLNIGEEVCILRYVDIPLDELHLDRTN